MLVRTMSLMVRAYFRCVCMSEHLCCTPFRSRCRAGVVLPTGRKKGRRESARYAYVHTIVVEKQAPSGFIEDDENQDLLQALAAILALVCQLAAVGAAGGLGLGGCRGGTEGGGFRMWEDLVGAVVMRTEQFAGTGFQEWKFRFEAATGACKQRLADFLRWAESHEIPVDPSLPISLRCTTHRCTTCFPSGPKARRSIWSSTSRASTGRMYGESSADIVLGSPAARACI